MRKILIANRGEIACRIIRTAHAMGLETVAVYSDADANAPHVKAATQAVHIGPSPAAESYLLAEKILDAARKTGADAVHPGYGFLSENAEFAESCAAADIIFIGPTPAAIRAMGLKDRAKKLMKIAGVPVVPGYDGEDQTLFRLQQAAQSVGYPLLIKAVAGGGGKGMRRVNSAQEFQENLVACQREAMRSFGNDNVLLEKYLENPRHIEVQVFSDTQGNTVHLFERDCSIQRRHQKMIEEAPAPGISEDMRSELGNAAVKAAKAISYQGAGTIEFIVDHTGFYFMEMNTRLQVEHPVTEEITGLDLVEWQIRVARGEKLPLAQSEITRKGAAIEVRLYAEDAENGFLPSTGHLTELELPIGRPGVRVDSGVVQGSDISMYYDPMIAKIICYAPDRRSAIEKLLGALESTVVTGVKTNRAYLARLLASAPFRDAKLSTAFIETYAADIAPPETIPDRAIAIAAMAAVNKPSVGANATSPWAALGAWQLNLPTSHRIVVQLPSGDVREIRLVQSGTGWDILGLEKPFHARGNWRDGHKYEADFAGELVRATVIDRSADIEVRLWGQSILFRKADGNEDAQALGSGDGKVRAPMPGRVLTLHVKVGQKIDLGERLAVLEAMKMEHRLNAANAGTITAIHVAENEQVSDGQILIEIEDEK
jgi:3-methylcrotonyl-CoA carboxylase alpha subunit